MGTSILNIWWVDDSKPGHSNQTRGLISALRRYREVEARRFVPANIRHNLRALVTAPEPHKPSLIVSAGHATHLTLLSLAHQHRCPSIVLMRPSLPLKLFDAVIAPAHDGLQDTNRILTTSGVINRVVPSEAQESTRGLIMLGGPSKHFHWSTKQIIEQVRQLLVNSQMKWDIVGSRRTPPEIYDAAKNLNCDILRPSELTTESLIKLMQRSGQIWVSPDSVSMVYEALTSGARVGLLPMESMQNSRVVTGINQLAAKGFVIWPQQNTALSQLSLGSHPKPKKVFYEADRAARWILERWAK